MKFTDTISLVIDLHQTDSNVVIKLDAIECYCIVF